MKTYAIKTTKGYLAIQGNTHWFENEPIGWALLSTRKHAMDMLESHHSAIGTASHEGGEVIEL